MSPNRAKELLPVIQAFAEGKQIQFRTSNLNHWEDAIDAQWYSDYEYRIKPHPREWWLVEVDKARYAFPVKPDGESIHVREVLE